VERIAERVLVLRDGAVVFAGAEAEWERADRDEVFA
jgi:hypothetical protein